MDQVRGRSAPRRVPAVAGARQAFAALVTLSVAAGPVAAAAAATATGHPFAALAGAAAHVSQSSC